MEPHASLFSYVMVTVVIFGGAAALTGRAVARTWRPLWQLALYVLLLTAFDRFLHFALFEGSLLSLRGFGIDLATLLMVALLAFRVTRTNQMVTQYDWLYERTGPFSWRSR